MQPSKTIQLFGLIGQDIDSASLQAQLDLVPRDTPLLVQINSDGGAVGEAVSMFALLRNWPGGVVTEVIGWALSAASLLAMAGSRRLIHSTSLVMVHAPWTDQGGNAQGLRQKAALLDTVALSMQSAYALSGQKPAVIAGWLDGQDHWFTADQALAVGLATEIVASAAHAAIPHNVYAQRHPLPAHLSQRITQTMPATTFPTGPNLPANADAIRAEAIRAEGERRADIRAHFDHLANRNDVSAAEVLATLRQCEDDPACTAAAAGLKALALLAKGTTPANGGGPRIGYESHSSDVRLDDFRAAAVDVLLARSGIAVAEPHPAVRDVQRLSVVSMCERILSLQGRSTRDKSPSQIIALGMSTSDFPSLLADVARKSLRNGYTTAPATHARWTAEREVPDFKPMTLVNLSEAPALLLKPELAEYKAGSMKDSQSKFQAKTWGRMLMLSREAMLNDDVAAFTGIPRAFGGSARRLEADQVYGLLQDTANLSDGQPLFHSSRGNLAPAGAAPTVTSIGLGRAAMRQQKDIAGLDYIDAQARYLIVPVALETAAEQLLASLNDPDVVSREAKVPQWIRGLELVADPRLDAVSATAWYLAANPDQLETITRAYITGEDRPHVEEAESFNRDALSMKARLDLAVGVVDWRGLYKNPGA